MSDIRDADDARKCAAAQESAAIHEVIRRWRLIATVGIVSAIVGVALSFLLVPRYESAATLAVVETASVQSGVTAVLERVGSLASMVGIGAASSATDIVVARLRSREFGLSLIKALDLGPLLFPSRWDATTDQWKITEQPPTDAKLFDEFDSNVRSVRVDSKTGLVQLSARLPDRLLAARLVNEMVAHCNALAQEEEIREVQDRIEFLMKEAESTGLVSLREQLYSVINMEIHRVAVLKSRRDFALRVIDPAFPADADEPASPNRLLIGVLGLLCGLFAAAAFVAARPLVGR